MASQPALSIATILQCVFINIPSVNWAFMKMDWILYITTFLSWFTCDNNDLSPAVRQLRTLVGHVDPLEEQRKK